MAALGLLAWPSAPAAAGPPSNRELAERVAALEVEIADLRARASRSRLDAARAEALRGLIHGVLGDAETRLGRLDDRQAGYDGDFFLEDPDGTFRLEVGAQVQLRHVYNRQAGSAEDDHRAGFEARRVRLVLSGHLLDPAWKYKVQLSAGRGDGVFEFQHAHVSRRLAGDWALRAGQFKPPLLREEGVSSGAQLAAERSLVNRAFRPGYAQGVRLEYQADALGLWLSVTDGLRSDNTGVFDQDNEWAVTLRAEGLFGAEPDWDRFEDFTSWPGEAPALMLGGGVHVETEAFGGAASERETIVWTADASLELGGANVMAAVIGSREREAGEADEDALGLVVQGGVLVAGDLELFARWEWADAGEGGDDLTVVTAGVTRFFAGHDLKLTLDAGVGLSPVDERWADGGAGWRADAGGNDGQVVVRTQLLLRF